MRRPLVLALILFPALLHAQQGAQTVSPGMSKAQVVSALGAPVTERTASEYTYVFYKNSCGKQCGMNDLVVLRSDSVVDAIFRSPQRHYTGTSSSPAQIPPKVAAHAKPAHGGKPMAVPARTDKAAGEPVKKPAAPATKAAEPVRTAPAATNRAAAPKPPLKPTAANDTRPSIPAKEPAVQPAPVAKTTPKPAPKSP